MKFIVVLLLIFSTCQASCLPKVIHKDVPKLKKMMSSVEKTGAWNTLKCWYHKAHEWLLGDDGLFTNIYYRTGDYSKPVRKHCRRCCCCRCCRHHSHTSSEYGNHPVFWWTQGYICGDGNGQSSIDNNGDSNGGGAKITSVSVPPAGDGLQSAVPSGNGGGGQVNGCGCGDCCSNIDCSGCGDCCSNVDCNGCGDGCSNIDCSGCGECLEFCCRPEVCCCCCYLLAICCGG